MTKLLRVKRAFNQPRYTNIGRYEPMFIPGIPYRGGDEGMDIATTQEFFLVDDRWVDDLMKVLAQLNPGCEVEVYKMEKVGQCPAGDYVAKEVSKDGLLPA
jgi:hypothetical protein